MLDIAKGFLCQRITAANKNTEDGKQMPYDTCEKFLPQTLHWKGFSPANKNVCMYKLFFLRFIRIVTKICDDRLRGRTYQYVNACASPGCSGV